MKRNRILQIICFTAALIMLIYPIMALSEGFGTDLILKGEYPSPISISISSPSYRLLSQFNDERKEDLNKLMKHLGLKISLDGYIFETSLLVDQDELYTVTESDEQSVKTTYYSFDSQTFYEQKTDSDTQEDLSDFNAFLENGFFSLNRMLDDLYPIFEKLPSFFSDYSKTAAVSLNFKGYGKGVKRITISLPHQYVTEHFPDTLSNLAETDKCRQFIKGLIFSGTQKIILLFDQNERLLRINYDGITGFTEESLRKVSLVWRNLRDADQIKDHITIKTPAQKGNDRDNLTFEREISIPQQGNHSYSWNLQSERKNGTTKQKISFTGDIKSENNLINGNILYTEKKEDAEKTIRISPSLSKENESEYKGTIEITNYSGKIVISSILADLAVSPGRLLSLPENGSKKAIRETTTVPLSGTDPVQVQLNSILIQKLLTLPDEDTAFFRKDIPDSIWDSLMQSMF